MFLTMKENARLRFKRSLGRSVLIDIPEYLATDLPECCGFKAEILYLIHWMLRRNRIKKRSASEWMRLKSEYLNSLVPNGRMVMFLACVLGYCKRSERYIQGKASYSYRVQPHVARNPLIKVRVFSWPIAKRLLTWSQSAASREKPIDSKLAALVPMLKFEQPLVSRFMSGRPDASDVMISVEKFSRNAARFSVDAFGGRLHTRLTHLKKDLRAFLRLEGDPEPLWEVDLRNSQPLFWAIEAHKAGRCDSLLLIHTTSAQIYEFLSEQSSKSIEKTKKSVLSVMCGQVGMTGRIPTLMRKWYPEAMRFLDDMKQSNFRNASKILQSREREFVVDRVCAALLEKHPGVWVSQIYDSILCQKRHVQLVSDEISTAFSEMNLPDWAVPSAKCFSTVDLLEN